VSQLRARANPILECRRMGAWKYGMNSTIYAYGLTPHSGLCSTAPSQAQTYRARLSARTACCSRAVLFLTYSGINPLQACCVCDTIASRSLAKLHLTHMVHRNGMYGRCRGESECSGRACSMWLGALPERPPVDCLAQLTTITTV